MLHLNKYISKILMRINTHIYEYIQNTYITRLMKSVWRETKKMAQKMSGPEKLKKQNLRLSTKSWKKQIDVVKSFCLLVFVCMSNTEKDPRYKEYIKSNLPSNK